MAGEIASLLISRMAVPVLYFMAFNRKPKATNLLKPKSLECCGNHSLEDVAAPNIAVKSCDSRSSPEPSASDSTDK